MPTTVRTVLYKQKELSDGTHPIILVVTKNRKRKKISLGISCKPNQWDYEQKLLNSSFPGYKNKNKTINRALLKAENIVFHLEDLGRDFSLKEFEIKYKGINAGNVFDFFDETIDRLNASGNVGNANTYKDSKNALLNFHPKRELKFNEINYSFLIRFEEHLRIRGVLNNTISVYFRTFRALFNRAIQEQKCNPESYPFNQYKISKLKNETSKRALTKKQIELIKSFKPDPNTKQEDSLNIFLFSFYTRGMNFNDIAKLKWGNIIGNRIEYRRSKNGKIFSLVILPPVQNILNHYKGFNPTSEYIFPILDTIHDTPEKIRNRIKSGLKRLNKHLKIIGEQVGLNRKLTSYVARHSYAMVLKRQGVSISQISEGMGHDSEKVTKIYLDSFENDTLDKMDELLL